MSELWFTLQYREKLKEKYDINVFYPYLVDHAEKIKIPIDIMRGNQLLGDFVLLFKKPWILEFNNLSDSIIYIKNSNESLISKNYIKDHYGLQLTHPGSMYIENKLLSPCVEEDEGKSKDGYIKVPFDTQTQKYSFWRKEWLEKNTAIELNRFKNEIQNRIKMKLQIIDLESNI